MSGVTAAEGEIAGWRNGSYAATIGYKSDNPYTLTYTLAPNTTGYDIKEIRVFSGWDGYRSPQSYDMLYALVGTQFSYTRRASSGLGYTVEYSTNLSGWLPATVTESPGTPDSKGVQTVTVTVTNAPANGKLFVRVRAQE